MSERAFSDLELDQLLDLLKESAEKLSEKSEERLRLLAKLTSYSFGVLAYVVSALFFLLGTHSAEATNFFPAELTRLFTAGAGALLFLLTGALLFSVWRMFREMRSKTIDMIKLRGVVGRLVRHGSQLEDHGNLTYTHRIALDLRLAEAEAALVHAGVANKKLGGDLERSAEFEESMNPTITTGPAATARTRP